MQSIRLKKCTDWFRVHEIKDIGDPSHRVARKELVVSLDQYPHDFGLGPNPREPDLKSRVSQLIGDTLLNNWTDFHLLNRGVVIVAKRLEYDNKSQRVRLTLEEAEDEESIYGILDGGNTNARINLRRENLADDEADGWLQQTYVNMQVLLPMLDSSDELSTEVVTLLNEIKETRNTSVQVKTKSLADCNKQFELMKAALGKEPYFQDIAWHEGQKGIDVQQLIILLMIYYPDFSKADGEPSSAYGHKERCLDAYIEYSTNEKERQELEKWIAQLPTLIILFDRLQATFHSHLPHFGKHSAVHIHDPKQYEKGDKKYRKMPAKTKLLGVDLKYSYPDGWIYPLFAAFRALTKSNASGVSWMTDPLEFWNSHGPELMGVHVGYLKQAAWEPKKVATNPLCYQAVRQKVLDLYKDEVLQKAGISI